MKVVIMVSLLFILGERNWLALEFMDVVAKRFQAFLPKTISFSIYINPLSLLVSEIAWRIDTWRANDS
jgi:hypothetical protein